MKERNYLFWTVLATFFLILLNLPESVSSSLRGFVRDGLATYQGAVTQGWSGLQRASKGAGGLSREDLAKECASLRDEVTTLRTQLIALNQVTRENSDLRDLLDFKKRNAFRTVACEVIARDDGAGWWQTLRLNKGRKDGIAENMPVITTEGVVGKTTEVSADACDVLLVSDRSFKAAVRFELEGSFGVLTGGGVSLRGTHSVGVLCVPVPFRVDYVRNDLAIKNGDWVVTSGLGGIFPAGLMVGRVTRVAPDDSGLYQHADVEPAADLARIRQVLVITGQ